MNKEKITSFFNDHYDESSDLLGRKHVASAVFNKLLEKNVTSEVIGVTANWGEGKTFVKDQIKRVLRKIVTNDDQFYNLHIIDFNPWQWVDNENIQDALLREIYVEIKKIDYGHLELCKMNFKNLIERVRIYSIYLPILLSLVLSIITAKILPESYYVIICIFIFVLAALSIYQIKKNQLMFEFFNFDKKMKKRNINEIIEKNKINFVIFLDDLDRLTPEQIIELFKVVKVNMDFNNFKYVMLYQKDSIIRAFDKYYGEGDEFLHKIVSIEFILPPTNQKEQHEQLINDVVDIFESNEKKITAEEYRLVYEVLLYKEKCLVNIRSKNKFLYNLKSSIILMSEEGDFDLQPADILAIEYLRLFHNKLYNFLKNNKKDILGQSNQGLLESEKLLMLIDKMNVECNLKDNDALNKLLNFILPMFKLQNGKAYYLNVERGVTQTKRLQHELYYDRYFLNKKASDLYSTKDSDRFYRIIKEKVVDQNLIFFRTEEEKGKISSFLLELEMRFKLSHFDDEELRTLIQSLVLFYINRPDMFVPHEITKDILDLKELIKRLLSKYFYGNEPIIDLKFEEEFNFNLYSLLKEIYISRGGNELQIILKQAIYDLFISDVKYLSSFLEDCPYSCYEITYEIKKILSEVDYRGFCDEVRDLLLEDKSHNLLISFIQKCPSGVMPNYKGPKYYDMTFLKVIFPDLRILESILRSSNNASSLECLKLMRFQ